MLHTYQKKKPTEKAYKNSESPRNIWKEKKRNVYIITYACYLVAILLKETIHKIIKASNLRDR